MIKGFMCKRGKVPFFDRNRIEITDTITKVTYLMKLSNIDFMLNLVVFKVENGELMVDVKATLDYWEKIPPSGVVMAFDTKGMNPTKQHREPTEEENRAWIEEDL